MELISNVEYWSNDSNNIDPKIENQDEIKQLIKKSQWLIEISGCNKNNLIVNENDKHVFNLLTYQKTPKQKTIVINITIVLI